MTERARRGRPARGSGDPFLALGLPPRRDLTDDDVRVAWRRIAAATHPDRDDGGDPVAFDAAAAAYAVLRTSFGRGEALAELDARAGRDGARGRRRTRDARGRPGVLALRIATAAGVSALALVAAGWAPASAGLIAGALTWLIATARYDLLSGYGGETGPGPVATGRDGSVIHSDHEPT
jgi:curved DNA-binding protein CbpA